MVLAPDFGRYTCVWEEIWPGNEANVHAVQVSTSNTKLANSEVVDKIPFMVSLRERRKLHHSLDANSYTTMFNFADADA